MAKLWAKRAKLQKSAIYSNQLPEMPINNTESYCGNYFFPIMFSIFSSDFRESALNAHKPRKENAAKARVAFTFKGNPLIMS